MLFLILERFFCLDQSLVCLCLPTSVRCSTVQLPFLLDQHTFASAFTAIRELAGQPHVCPSVTALCLSVRVSVHLCVCVCVKAADNVVWCGSA